MIYTIKGIFDGYGTRVRSKHNWKVPHIKWKSLDQHKNDIMVDITDDISLNEKSTHTAYTEYINDNPDSHRAIPNYEKIRKTLYKARDKTGAIPLPVDGKHANDFLSQSRFCRNYYGQKMARNDVTEEEMAQYDDVQDINDRIKEIHLRKKELIAEENKLNQIKHKKFDNYDGMDSLLFLGGRDDGMYQVFCERELCHVLNEANHILFDGSWGATPLFSTKCKRRNHFRMEWTINACFHNPDDSQCPLTIKCASILFAVDKPPGSLYEDALRYLIKRCFEEFNCELFKYRGQKIVGMADFEKAMRNAIIAVIIFIIIIGCWFHFCKCLNSKIGELKLMKLYKDKDDHDFYKFMRGFLMLPLLPLNLIKPTFDLLVALGDLNEMLISDQTFNCLCRIWRQLG